jgi:hypothetical protein
MNCDDKGHCTGPCEVTLKAVQSNELMPIQRQTIHIRIEAPQKPSEGTPCNGCGVCCLTEPCPLGVLLSKRRRGACVALRWSEEGVLYRCGAISETREVLHQVSPPWIRPLVVGLSPIVARLAHRWIAAGKGCDSTLEVASSVGSKLDGCTSSTISLTLADLPARHHPLPAKRHDKPNSTSEEF